MRLRALGIGTVVVLATIGVLSAFIGVHGGPGGGGTLLVSLSSRAGDSIGDTQIEIHSLGGGWSAVAHLSNRLVPAAPRVATAASAEVAPGRYDGIRLAGRELAARILVSRGSVEPVLVTVAAGVPEDAFAGNSDYNNGLLAAQGALKRMPAFELLDQSGRTVSGDSLKGSVVVLAAFHTTCHDTCPLYTAILHQLAGRVPPSVRLVEVSTDPANDTVAALQRYAQLADAGWTLLTGSPESLAAFWSTFGVQLSGADSHSNFLGVFDERGDLHHIENGVPDAGSLPGGLAGVLSGEGIRELRSHGDGWDAATVADEVQAASGLGSPSLAGSGPAPGFSIAALDRGRVSLSGFAGRPLVLNFWASSCAPCRTEMPLIERLSAAHGVGVLLVDERDLAPAARSLLRGLGITDPVGYDPDGVVGRLYGVNVLPVTVFIRPDGTVEGKYLGQTDAAILNRHLAAIAG